ncbi:quinone oxidoreductase family protein [Miltoncostaea oceani]|uniref:quinone oxidoreductase family protein n=1 Tax=Miltoncostaea oceani TaxID=2843216 RepID=UPI001C3E7D71|nr:zinc-binding alcohol dehydrogenase family protein [Miltoncostaea oceani]
MRGLSVTDRGATPVVAEVPEPVAGPGTALVRVSRASINPLDLAIAAGRFYMPVPDPPYVPGAEIVGEVIASEAHPPGTRVWAIGLTGGIAEVAAVPEAALVPVPEGCDDDLAVALGIAGLAGWMPVLDRGALVPGETVAVLAAGGAVGQVAVQAARSAGAARVVAVARSDRGRARALDLGADVALPTGPDLADALRAECPDGLDLVIDPLWGDSAVAALAALAPRGRLVQVGNAESPTAAITAGGLRGRRLDIRGFSVLVEEPERLRTAYAELAAAALAGEVVLDVTTVPLEGAPDAWRLQAEGAGGIKTAIDPR